MAAFPSKALLSLGLLIALLAGCGRAGQTSEGDTAVAPAADADEGPAVTSEDIARDPSQPIERVLMSRFPGVWITQTGDGGIAVRIRGVTTINASSAPLYVVDGVPIQAGPGGSLTGINPYDIETIKVLKDPVDTAMYGFRGGNGVIVITTKRP